jgi:serine/threonine protein kinase
MKTGYGKEVDLWSIGITMFFLLRGQLPFDSKDKRVIIERTLRAEPYFDELHWGKISNEGKKTKKSP